jgi:hypothetical protein
VTFASLGVVHSRLNYSLGTFAIQICIAMDGIDALVNFIRKMVMLESFEQLKCKEKL